jgi:hypothetical protein
VAKTATTSSQSVGDLLAQVTDAEKRGDGATLIAMLQEVTGEAPVAWGTMIGFGHYHYVYPGGHEGDSFLVGFAPRKAEFSIYLMGTYAPEEMAKREALLARLGRHRMGKACLYVRRLSDIDLDVLRELAVLSVTALRGAYSA